MPETRSSNKQNLKTVLGKDRNTASGSSKRHVIQKPTRSDSPCYVDYPRHEFVFSIDHVLDEILRLIDKNSLLQCRLVSHQWRLASNAVLKLKRTDNSISFTYNGHYNAHIISSADLRSGEFPGLLDQSTLQYLTQFLKKSHGPGTGPFTLDTFPCNKIVIRGGSILNPQVRSFLDTYGKNIQNLSVDCSSESPYISYSHLVKKLDHILCVQVPNLKFFSFLMNCANVHSYYFARNDVREGQNQRAKNTKLHTLTTASIPGVILESIIGNCPNLKQINLDFKDLRLLMEPIDRMHLLRKFCIQNPDGTQRPSDLLRKVEGTISSISILPGKPPIKFTSVYINFDSIRFSWIWDDTRTRSCLVRLINKILDASSDTLESITFKNYDASCALDRIKWAPVSPKVREITLCPIDSCGLEVFLFDGTFKIQQAFPKLQKVNYDVTLRNILDSRPEEFKTKLNLGPVWSVVLLKVNILLTRSTADVEAAERLQFRDHYSNYFLSKLFPRAELSVNFQHLQKWTDLDLEC